MRKFFRQKYILCLLTTLTLVLITLNVVLPKIEEYNRKVYEEQQRLRREADDIKDRGISFGLYDSGQPFAALPIFFLSMLFLSLIFTKRITLSFFSLSLFAFLFFGSTEFFISKLRKAGLSASVLNSEYFGLLLASGEMMLSFRIGGIVCRFAKRPFQSQALFK